MIPKVQCCLDALEKGVQSVHVLDGRVPHTILLEIFTAKGIVPWSRGEGIDEYETEDRTRQEYLLGTYSQVL